MDFVARIDVRQTNKVTPNVKNSITINSWLLYSLNPSPILPNSFNFDVTIIWKIGQYNLTQAPPIPLQTHPSTSGHVDKAADGSFTKYE